jgi:hypothetical protein
MRPRIFSFIRFIFDDGFCNSARRMLGMDSYHRAKAIDFKCKFSIMIMPVPVPTPGIKANLVCVEGHHAPTPEQERGGRVYC